VTDSSVHVDRGRLEQDKVTRQMWY